MAKGMRSRERFFTALDHKEPDLVPQSIRWSAETANRLAEIFGVEAPEGKTVSYGGDLSEKIGNDLIIIQTGINAMMEMAGGGVMEEGDRCTSEWGVVYERQNQFDNPVVHPLEESRDVLDDYQWPDPNEPRRMAELDLVVSRYKDTHAILTDVSSTMMEASTAHLRGMQNLILDLYDDPARVGRLFDGLADYCCELACHAIEHGTDILRIGDDIGVQNGRLIPPALWQTHAKPRIKRLIDTWKAKDSSIRVMYHSCGDFSSVADDFVEMGFDLLSTMQPVAGFENPRENKRRWGDKVMFKGGLDVQRVLPNGSNPEIRWHVRRLIKAYAPGGGYVFQPAHLVYQDVSTDHVWAMLEAFKECRRYPIDTPEISESDVFE